jgi:hypothetical protein
MQSIPPNLKKEQLNVSSKWIRMWGDAADSQDWRIGGAAPSAALPVALALCMYASLLITIANQSLTLQYISLLFNGTK